jgi:hypothetical protein
VSLFLAGGASAGTGGSAAEALRDAAPPPEVTLNEEEISDVSLATFYVFDKENYRARISAKFQKLFLLARACAFAGPSWR